MRPVFVRCILEPSPRSIRSLEVCCCCCCSLVCANIYQYFHSFSLSRARFLPISLCITIGGQRVKVDATAQRPPPLHATIKFTQNTKILFITWSELRSVAISDSVWMALPINELISDLNCLWFFWFFSYVANEAFLFLIFFFQFIFYLVSSGYLRLLFLLATNL